MVIPSGREIKPYDIPIDLRIVVDINKVHVTTHIKSAIFFLLNHVL